MLSWFFLLFQVQRMMIEFNFIVAQFHLFIHNYSNVSIRGDVYLLCRLLLARDDPRVYNLREKAFAKVLSRILGCEIKDVLEDFEKGDMSETSKKVQPHIVKTNQFSFSRNMGNHKRKAV